VLGITRTFFMRGVSLLQVAAQMYVQGDGNTHYDKRANTQDQKPPDHPHSDLG